MSIWIIRLQLKYSCFNRNYAGVINASSKELLWIRQIMLKMILYWFVVVLVLLDHVQRDRNFILLQYRNLTLVSILGNFWKVVKQLTLDLRLMVRLFLPTGWSLQLDHLFSGHNFLVQ